MPYHLLLVEDDPSAAEMTAFYLRQEGFGVTTAADGPTAVQLFAASKPHLAIVDVMLPGFDGFELCRRLRHESNLPILLLTARTTDFIHARLHRIAAPTRRRVLLSTLATASKFLPPHRDPAASPSWRPGPGRFERATD